MKNINKALSFLAIGETHESTSKDFKRYVGLGESYPVALNPTKKELEALYGTELNYEPEYFGTDENGVKWVRFDFLVRTKPESCNGIDILTHATITLSNEKYYNAEKTKVRVLDSFGNSMWVLEEDANNHKPIYNKNGNPAKIADYHIARRGEPELCDFLRKFINTPDPFDYKDGIWSLKKLKHINELTKEDGEKNDILTFEQCAVALDKSDFEAFFRGDVSGIWNILKSRMNTNKSLGITLLYGVKTKEGGKLSQTVCTGYDMILRKKPSAKEIARLENNMASAKASNMYQNIVYKVQELQEYTVEATNLEKPVEESTDSFWND